MRRICVIRVTGSGKSTLARRIGQKLDIQTVELDALFWGPNWTPVDPQIFRHRVATIASSDAWVTDGNYSRARDVLWPRADTFVWLDLPFFITFARLIRRTFSRRLENVELWNGNRESLREHFLSKDSLFLWAINTHPRYRREFPPLLRVQTQLGRSVYRLRSDAAAERWLRDVCTLESQARRP